MPESLGRDYRRRQAHNARGKKRLKTWQKVLIGLSIPATLLVAAAIALFAFMGSFNAKLALDPAELDKLQQVLVSPADPQEPYYILVLGSDARAGELASRSDTIMLCRVDTEAKHIAILSIPRDTKIELEGYGTQKINAAMAYDGPTGAVEAVSKFVGVEIAHIMLVNFEGFTDLIDRLGGITVDVPFYTSLNGIELQPGVQTLNSEQAMAFARCRKEYALGDFQRAANQRALLKAVVKEIMQVPAPELPGYMSALAECVNTDLTFDQLVDLVLNLEGLNTDADLYSGQVPSTTATIDGVSYVITTEDVWTSVREKYVEGVVPFVDENNQPAVVD
ncbi:MAG: LCP family protein [Coriobacteriales bacterium]|jgi:LCP family protein required for cell wall assembly|nr:LCP family protein [Coriobacteriales bacterium]